MSTLSSAKRMICLIHKYKVFLNFESLRTRLTITLCTRSRFFDATESTSNSDVISQKHQQSALLSSENRSFRWDPNSGQFSFSQDHDSLLARGIEVVDDLSSSHPDSIAIIQRKYSEKRFEEVGVTYRCLRRRVSSISSLLASVAPASTRVTVVLLPVSVTAVASILALARARHCLVSTEFSAAALQELLATNMVGCLVTSHTHLPALLPLLQQADLCQPRVVCLEDSEVDIVSGLEDLHVDPMFALYTGGPSSLIAGTREMSGYYQVTSNVQPNTGGNDDHHHIVPVEDEETVEDNEVERKFKKGKETNSFRLNYIRDILNK